MATYLTLYAFVMTAVTLTWAFPNGGPYYSCKSILPGHNDGPQSTSPPYKLSASHTSVPVGGSTSVTLEGLNSTPFMGFMCAASVFDDGSNRTCGAFSMTTATSDNAQLLQCSGSAPDTGITHVNKQFKQQIGFDWTVPADASIGSTYKIRCTFVQSFDIYWTNSLVKITVVDGNKNVTPAGGSNAAIVNIESSTTSSTATQVTTGSNSINSTGSKQANTESTTQAGTGSTKQDGTGSTTQAGKRILDTTQACCDFQGLNHIELDSSPKSKSSTMPLTLTYSVSAANIILGVLFKICKAFKLELFLDF